MSLIADVRRAQRTASDPARSIWVRANAGSGKTRVLVERILRILLDGTPPDRILALTFTKAAAAEMKERLFDRLGGWTALDEDTLSAELLELEGSRPSQDKLARARRLFARALETPGGLKVQTIHGFCQSVLERFPIEAGVPPHFQVLDEALGTELRTEAKAIVLSTIEADETALAAARDRVIDEVGETGFDELIDTLVGHPALVARARARDPNHRLLAKRLGLPEGCDGATLEADFIAACPLDLIREAARAMIGTGQKSMIARGQAFADFTANPVPGGIAAYTRLFITQTGDPVSEKTLLTQKVHNRDHLLGLLQAEQDRVLGFLDTQKALATFERTCALHTLGRAILTQYDRMKAIRGMLDYDDLILSTARLLEQADGAAAWVLYKLDQGIDHILVDEAQDTSPDQWRVVSALAHEFFTGQGAREGVIRTVFAVGDEKQSIYSFQGADPRGFALTETAMAGAAEQAGLAFQAVSLPVSFRSAPPILELVDEVAANPAIAASLTHDELEVLHQPFRTGHAGSVELWPLIEPEDEPGDDPWDVPLDVIGTADPKARLAARIAKTIRHWLDTGERLEARNRSIVPGDILVLVRKRDVFVEALVRALKAEGVPVAGTDRIKVTDQIAVMDLMAAARFALLPDDDLTLATVLRSPLVGLSEDALYTLAHRRKGSLWGALRHPDFADARDWLDQLLKAARRLRPADFFQHIVSVMGGRNRLAARLGAQVHDAVDEFLALARAHEESETPSLQGFLAWVERAGAEIKRDMERGTGQVRIMTAHGAKGLEANLVILPDTMSAPTGRTVPPILRLNPDSLDDPLFVWARGKASDDTATAQARAALMEADRAEYCRLLYVALTRARDRLIVCGYRGKREQSAPGWHSLIEPAMEALGEACDITFADGETASIRRFRSEQTTDPVIEAGEAVIPARPADPGWLARPAPAEPSPSRPLVPSRAALADPPVRSPLGSGPGAGAEARQRGTLIHRLLELLADCAPAARAELGAQFLERAAPHVDEATRRTWLAEVLAILDDPAFAQVFAPGSLAEVPVSGLVPELGEGLVLSGQIDRLAVSDTQVLIIDFKTNRPPPERPEEVAEAYLVQLASYRAALRAIYPAHTIRAGLLWTDAPRLMEVPPGLLDGAEIRARARGPSAAS